MYLVGKCHPQSDHPEIEWRLSFSMLEIEISNYIPLRARQAYLMCKQFLNNAKQSGEPSYIESYQMKTCLLWLLKENQWNDLINVAPVHYMLHIFKKLYSSLDNMLLYNFFFPHQNILGIRDETELLKSKDFLLKYCIDMKDKFSINFIVSSPHCPIQKLIQML